MFLNYESILMGVLFGVLVVGFILLWFTHFKVEEGHLAVLTRFGAVVRDPINVRLFEPGGHFKLPWDKVITFSIMERIIDLSGEKSGKHAMTSDGTVVRLDSKIRISPSKNDCYSYLFELKNPMGYIRESFICILRNEIANFVLNPDQLGSYFELRRDRKRLNDLVESSCCEQISGGFGIKFCGVDLIDIVPPHELEEALNGIQDAKINSEILYKRAEADASQKIAAAEQGVAISQKRAEANKKELEALALSIRKLIHSQMIDNYLEHRQIELLGHSKLILKQYQGEAQW